MMFSLAGMISLKMLPEDRSKRYFTKGGKKGISCKLVGALEMALLFALFESFLAGTGENSQPVLSVDHAAPEADPKSRLKALISLCRDASPARPVPFLFAQVYAVCTDELVSARFLPAPYKEENTDSQYCNQIEYKCQNFLCTSAHKKLTSDL